MPTGPTWNELHDMVNPQIVVPNHGEHRHLREHAKLANARPGPGKSIVAVNGTMLDLRGEQPSIVGRIHRDRAHLSGWIGARSARWTGSYATASAWH